MMTRLDPYAAAKAGMLDDIEREYAFTRGLTGRAMLPERVAAALRVVPRHLFVPAELCHLAYGNHPLGIGRGQTISQPFIVALMTDLLDPPAAGRVLEVGCGCGYQAAVLSQLVAEVYSVEILSELAETATSRLARLGYDNVTVANRDGALGWPEFAPFDGILVAAAAETVPPALLEQLKPGGRLVLPVGSPYGYQELVAITRRADGVLERRDVLGVAFVPLTGGHGQGRGQH